MPTSQYFTTWSAQQTNQQNLLEDLIVQSIRISGIDVYYVPRESETSLNALLGEQPDTRFVDAYMIEMYLVNVDGYEGENEFLSKFGIEVRSSSVMIVAHRSFQRWVRDLKKPREGDLIYVPMMKRIFEIKDVDVDANFHQIGRKETNPYYYELRVEQFKYSQEQLDTGIDEIDDLETRIAYRIDFQMGLGSGNYLLNEEVIQTVGAFANTATVADWNPQTKLLSVMNLTGDFSNTANVIGRTSNVYYMLSSYDPLKDSVPDDLSDNEVMQDETDLIILRNEKNPLGDI